MAGEAASRGAGSGSPRRPAAAAFAPGRVNLIGEHTDYNQGLALPFAIAEGVVVRAETADPDSPGAQRIYAHASDLDELDEFELADVSPAEGWRAFVRGATAELQRAGVSLVGARLEIGGDLEQGAGLSSSAALEVALCLALADLASVGVPLDRIAIARLCARVENDWVGAQTGMLDQLASLYGEPDMAVLIDFRTLQIDPVPLRLEGWRFVVRRLRRKARERELRLQRTPGRVSARVRVDGHRLAARARARTPWRDCPSRCALAPSTCSAKTRGSGRPSRRCARRT